MTIPFNAGAGQTIDLPQIDQATFYHTDTGAPTSAQFYINLPGVAVKDACTWGTSAKREGNWAPINIGGSDNHVNRNAFWSMFPNMPTQPNPTLPYNIRLTGSGISPSTGCVYDGPAGKFIFEGGERDAFSGTASGCTIAVEVGGSLLYELY
jgi:hypothetical protein